MGAETCAVVICHGMSEYKMISDIQSKLRLNIKVYARQKGRSSIQIDKLPDIFQNRTFKSVKALTSEFETIKSSKRQLIDCKIFTIMDVDDCKDQSVRKNYMSGHISGIGDHELKPYIVPIYFKENLEDALRDIGFPFVAKTDREKHNYVKVFDPVKGVLVDEESIEKLQRKCAKSEKTNLDLFLKYCLEHRLNID